MYSRILIFKILITSLILCSDSNFGQKKLGYFEYEKVKKSFPYYLKNMEKIEFLKVRLNDSLMKLIQPIELENSRTCISYTKNELLKVQKNFLKQYEIIEDFRKFALDKVKFEKDKLETLTEKEISSFIEDFCELNEISFLLKKSNFIVCKGCSDYTLKFIKYFNLKN